jgi:hypothetical protein
VPSILQPLNGTCEWSAALLPRNESPYPHDRRVDRPHSRSGRGDVEKNTAHAGNRTAVVRPIVSRITQLSRLNSEHSKGKGKGKVVPVLN